MKWDVFISHASEDKASVADPLYAALREAGLRVWYDTAAITLGDSLRGRMDEGLAHAEFGVVVLSPAFFAKHWTQRELDALAQREVQGKKVILPVWHDLTAEEVREQSPLLSGRAAVRWSDGVAKVVTEIMNAVRGSGDTYVPGSATSNAPTRTNSQIVFLMSGSGYLGAFPLRSATIGADIHLVIEPEDDRSSGELSRILNDRGGLGIAFRTTGVWATIREKTQSFRDDRETWDVHALDESPSLHAFSEMSTQGKSDDDIAELRARRILLGEKSTIPTHDRLAALNAGMLESLVVGISGKLKATPIYSVISPEGLQLDAAIYCEVLRLVAVLFLKLSLTVETIFRLEIVPIDRGRVRVLFEGRRGKKFSNKEARVLKLEGEVDVLTASQPR